ncbi:MAG: cobalamin B12-binding domain-containing protein [Elusimicrobia bacterium]|nr:cobalamin B12-binding domain-containing protein [Elusimicrobiota bacterium]
MIKNYSSRNSDIVLITLNEMDIGVRTLSAFLKVRGYTVILGFFNDWKENDQRELTNILQWVGEINPRVIGISSVEFSRAKAGTLIAALRKEGRVVIVGGTDITLNPEQYLTYADYAVLGEGEYALAEFLEAELKEFSLIPDSGGLRTGATEAMCNIQDYGCGCFWLVKNGVASSALK